MAVELVFAPEVEQDINEAYAWYEERRYGLGEEFLGCVEACVQGICRAPELHAKATKTIDGHSSDGFRILSSTNTQVKT